MRERRPEDWRADLAARRPLEARVGRAIDAHPCLTLLHASTAATDRLDFQVLAPRERLIEIELKEKRQPYRDWAPHAPGVPEERLFILDELALRKLVDAGRYAFLLVCDHPARRWSIWSTAELVLAPKTRVARALATGVDRQKGKVLLDTHSAAHHAATTNAALSAIVHLVRRIDRCWHDITPWPQPAGAA